jgi:hypothetical protein
LLGGDAPLIVAGLFVGVVVMLMRVIVLMVMVMMMIV